MPPMYASAQCPKCQGPRDAKALYCPFCGAVFERTILAPPVVTAAPPAPEPIVRAVVDPYRPPAVAGDLYDPEGSAGAQTGREAVIAPLGRRFGAWFLDEIFLGISFFVGLVLMVLAGVRPLEAMEAGVAEGSLPMSIWMMMIVAVLPVGAVNVYYLARDGQTLGKKALGIRIVRDNTGEPVALLRLLLLRSVVSWILGAVPIVGGLFSIVDACFIFRPDRRCVHDHIADTKVVVV